MDPIFLQSGIAVAALAALAAWIDRRMIPLWEQSVKALEANTLVMSRALDVIERACALIDAQKEEANV
jgi:hypothetical protein